MGQINLYKIDISKGEDFFENLNKKFECIGTQEYQLIDNENVVYEVGTYLNIPNTKHNLEWQWILDEYDYGKIETEITPRAILTFQKEGKIYVATYGFAYFMADKFCDVEFAFEFAKRIDFKQIKTTTLTAPNSQRNKMINVYLDYHDLEFDSGESYAKIKAKVKLNDNFTLHNELVEIGHSIKTILSENSVDCILKFIEYVETVLKDKIHHNIPIFSKERDEKKVKELDERLLNQIDRDIDCINISELDIIGATEVFNHNDSTFMLKYKKGKEEEVDELSKDNVIRFINANQLQIRKDFLDIKVVSKRNGEPVCTEIMKKLIDYTDDDKRSLLLKGEWYSFNDDYIQYLQDSIFEIPVVYNPIYDFSDNKLKEYVNKKYVEEAGNSEYENLTEKEIRKKLKNKYYAERVFNNVLEEEFDFENHDRNDDETGAGKIELMDLYKDRTMFAVKIGNSSAKLSYAVEQSISSTKMYKHKKLIDMPEIDNVAVWIILKNHKHLPLINDKPDLSKLRMIMLKNRLDSWKKEVRLLGYKPIIYLNYWN